MKILLEDYNGNPIRIYHHSKDILIREPNMELKIFGSDGLVEEIYEYLGWKDLGMMTINSTGNLEVGITIIVGNRKETDD